jgi:hypothetical protein
MWVFYAALILTFFVFPFGGTLYLLSRQKKLDYKLSRLERQLNRLLNPAAAETPAETPPEPAIEPVTIPDSPVITPLASSTESGRAVSSAALAEIKAALDDEKIAALSLWKNFVAFTKGGNLWAAGGIILLFIAFALLLTYMARRGLFTLELRIAAAALAGILLLVLGYKIRKKRTALALILQGGGIGLLYLSIFAAAKLTGFLPAPAALALLAFLVVPASALALLQNSEALAVFGFLGGYAAPVLLSVGVGVETYVLIFSFYLVLNIAVAVVGKWKLWRGLNLLAFVCTFGVSLIWLMIWYRPADLLLVEPFIAAYIVLFTFLAVRSSTHTQISVKNFIDLPLTVGTPFAGALVQWQVFASVKHGPAAVSLVFAALYLGLTFFIWKKKGISTRRLAEGYLTLSVLLANLALPLEVSREITGAVWAAEGVVIFIMGCRNKSRWVQIGGMIFHFSSALLFFLENGLRFSGRYFWREIPLFQSPGFVGGIIVALSGLVMALIKSSSVLPFQQQEEQKSKKAVSLFFALWGFLWWFAVWNAELVRKFPQALEGFFICACLSALGAWALARWLKAPALLIALPVPLVTAAFIVGRVLLVRPGLFKPGNQLGIFTYNFFSPGFTRIFLILSCWAWLIFIITQGGLLFFSAGKRPVLSARLRAPWLAVYVLILVTLLTCTGRALVQSAGLASSWVSFAGLFPTFACLVILSVAITKVQRPAGREAAKLPGATVFDPFFTWVFTALPGVLMGICVLWFLLGMRFPGDPAPLPLYLPGLNPLDLQQAFCVAIPAWYLFFWYRHRPSPANAATKKQTTKKIWAQGALFILIFLWISVLAARSAHHYLAIAGIGYLAPACFSFFC